MDLGGVAQRDWTPELEPRQSLQRGHLPDPTGKQSCSSPCPPIPPEGTSCSVQPVSQGYQSKHLLAFRFGSWVLFGLQSVPSSIFAASVPQSWGLDGCHCHWRLNLSVTRRSRFWEHWGWFGVSHSVVLNLLTLQPLNSVPPVMVTPLPPPP